MTGVNCFDAFAKRGLNCTDSGKRLMEIDTVKFKFCLQSFKQLFTVLPCIFEKRNSVFLMVNIVPPLFDTLNDFLFLQVNRQLASQYMNVMAPLGQTRTLFEQNPLGTADHTRN